MNHWKEYNEMVGVTLSTLWLNNYRIFQLNLKIEYFQKYMAQSKNWINEINGWMNDKIMKMLTNIDYWLSYYYI